MRYLSGASLVCALTTPVLVVTGSVLAAARQPPGYDPVRHTLSGLASLGATDRWIMGGTLVVAGIAYVVIALGMTAVSTAARIVLAVAGLAVALAGMFPQPIGGSSPWHMGSAAVGWIALIVWPLVVCPRPAAPGLLSRRSTWLVTAVLLTLMLWFFVQLLTGGELLGLSERILLVALTLWPAAVALAHRVRRAPARSPAVLPTADRVAR